MTASVVPGVVLLLAMLVVVGLWAWAGWSDVRLIRLLRATFLVWALGLLLTVVL